ncbi:MAG: hypothetical protein HKL96_11770 [Phycisphaerales bacterium]|nr:hypothetical protein [Phycisphaerales bacterium]
MMRSKPSRSAVLDEIELPVPRLPRAFNGLRIAHLSDLHLTYWNDRFSDWKRSLERLKCDLLVITGDLAHRAWLWRQTLPNVMRLLEGISPDLGIYFILGNHDSPDIGPALARFGLRQLCNEAVILKRGGERLALVGIAQHRRIDTDIPAALRNVQADDCKIMLLHYPDLVHAAAAARVDVCLAGHTHGGQICYPDGRPIIRHDSLPREMCAGVNRVDHTWLVVSRGMGKAAIRVRMFCPPQMMVITLARGPVPALASD